MKFSPFETLNLGFILKPLLKFRVKFQPRSYKTYSYTKKNLRTKLVRNWTGMPSRILRWSDHLDYIYTSILLSDFSCSLNTEKNTEIAT